MDTKVYLPREMAVPVELDRRILAAASRRVRRRRMRPVMWSFAAAAAALVVGVVFFLPEKSAVDYDRQELIAMADWSDVSQESYLLATDLNLAPEVENAESLDYTASDWSMWI